MQWDELAWEASKEQIIAAVSISVESAVLFGDTIRQVALRPKYSRQTISKQLTFKVWYARKLKISINIFATDLTDPLIYC